MSEEEFNIKRVMKTIKEDLRKGFTSELDFQFIIGATIRDIYKNATVIMEYKYPKGTLCENKERQYVDIMAVINGKWYPIELKYKYKECNINITKELEYKLENHSCKTNHRKKYCMDIIRLLQLRKSDFKFEEGYAIVLTNYVEFRYKKKKCQNRWLLYDENIIDGVKEINEKYDKKMYNMEWEDYDRQKKFSYLITTINKNDKI